MKIFIVNGAGGSGKTSFEKMVKNIAAEKQYRIYIVSTINYVKLMARGMGWRGEKDYKSRRFLSDLKDALTRWNDKPYRIIQESIEDANALGYNAIFIDCREPDEIKRFVQDYGAITILVQRGETVIFGNHADDDVKNYQYDIVIDNSRGLDELKQEATIFVETWIEGEDD